MELVSIEQNGARLRIPCKEQDSVYSRGLCGRPLDSFAAPLQATEFLLLGFAGGFPVAPCTPSGAPSDGVGFYRTKWCKASNSLQGTRFSLFQRAFRLRVEDSALWTPSPPLRMEMTSTEKKDVQGVGKKISSFPCLWDANFHHLNIQLLFGESECSSWFSGGCGRGFCLKSRLPQNSAAVPRLYFLRLFVDRGGRACYTGCNFIRTVLSHERL